MRKFIVWYFVKEKLIFFFKKKTLWPLFMDMVQCDETGSKNVHGSVNVMKFISEVFLFDFLS